MSPRLPIIDDLRDAANEREAALVLLHMPLFIMVSRAAVIREALDRRNFSHCANYFDNVLTACRLVRTANARMAGDMGTARIAIALQHAGVTLAAAMDAAIVVDGHGTKPLTGNDVFAALWTVTKR